MYTRVILFYNKADSIERRQMDLSLNTAGSISAHKVEYFFKRSMVNITRNRVLQSRSSHREIDSFLSVIQMHKPVNKACGIRIAAADTVDERIDLIVLGLIELIADIKQAGPAVIGRRMRFTQGGRSALEMILLNHGLEHILVSIN